MAIYRIKLFALNEGEHKEENDRKYCIDITRHLKLKCLTLKIKNFKFASNLREDF